MDEKGFTLLELIMVIMVIGILIAIALPFFFTAREIAYDREAITNLRIIKAAQQNFYSDHGYYWSDPGWCYLGTGANNNANLALHINLPTTDPLSWTHCFITGGSSFEVRTSRSGVAGYNRGYTITNLTDVECFYGSCRTTP